MKVSFATVLRYLNVHWDFRLVAYCSLFGRFTAPEWASPWAWLLLIPVLLLPFQAVITGRNRLAVPTLEG